jgi:hypothetical protein
MEGSLLREMWFTIWPVIKEPLDAGCAVPIFRGNWHLTPSQPVFILIVFMKYCEIGSNST